jgi:hypothetical protein
MLTHFGRAVNIRGRLFNVLREKEVTGDPAGAFIAEEAPGPPRGKYFLQRKSTGLYPKTTIYTKMPAINNFY